jgi:FMN phosphatase YigB (HAD superfamily)
VPMLDELLDQGPDANEQRVGVVPREMARRHARMIGTKVPRGQRLSRPEDFDAVTLDAYGTLLELRDPLEALARLAPGFGRDAIEPAFEREFEYYRAHALEARDEVSLAELNERCVAVFNEALGSSLTADEYVGALVFTWIEGARAAVERLRARGLALAVVSNWDVSLHDRVAELRVPVVTSADAGVAKPDPAILHRALDLLGVEPGRTLHVGDTEEDERVAGATGVAFAPAPLARVDERWR